MKKKILISASWCGPCHMLKSRLKEQKLEADEVLDLDENMDTAKKYRIRSVPTLLVIEEDESFYTATGSEDIIEELKRKDV